MATGIHLEPINMVFDGVLIVLSIWMALTARKLSLGGAMGKTVSLVVWGAIVLGLAHATETILDQFFGIHGAANELIHRGIILVGFILLTLGLSSLASSFGGMRKK